MSPADVVEQEAEASWDDSEDGQRAFQRRDSESSSVDDGFSKRGFVQEEQLVLTSQVQPGFFSWCCLAQPQLDWMEPDAGFSPRQHDKYS